MLPIKVLVGGTVEGIGENVDDTVMDERVVVIDEMVDGVGAGAGVVTTEGGVDVVVTTVVVACVGGGVVVMITDVVDNDELAEPLVAVVELEVIIKSVVVVVVVVVVVDGETLVVVVIKEVVVVVGGGGGGGAPPIKLTSAQFSYISGLLGEMCCADQTHLMTQFDPQVILSAFDTVKVHVSRHISLVTSPGGT